MALTIENGTGVTGADSFATVAQYDAAETDYFGVPVAGTVVLKEAALRRAYLYMRSLKWKVSASFPTFGGTIPGDILTAQSILARIELQTPGALQPSVVPGQMKVLTQVGEISWTSLAQGGTDAQRTVATMALDLLSSYIDGQGSTRFLARA